LASEERVLETIRLILGTAVAAPGHPELGPFYLVRGTLSATERLTWSAASGNKTRVYLAALAVASALGQSPLPYSVPGSAGNDVLYEGDPSYPTELAALMSEVGETVLTHIGDLDIVAKGAGDDASRTVAATTMKALLLEMAEQLVLAVDLEQPDMAKLLLRTVKLAHAAANAVPTLPDKAALARLEAILQTILARAKAARLLADGSASLAEETKAAVRLGIDAVGAGRAVAAKAAEAVLVPLAERLHALLHPAP
jgi:hypothetical protein